MLNNHLVLPAIGDGNRNDCHAIKTTPAENEAKFSAIDESYRKNEIFQPFPDKSKEEPQIVDNRILRKLTFADLSTKNLDQVHFSAKDMEPSINEQHSTTSEQKPSLKFCESSINNTTSTTITLSKPLVFHHEMERQNKIASLISETKIQSRIHAVPLEPLKAPIRPAGIKSGIESKNRNFTHRYNNRSTSLAGL